MIERQGRQRILRGTPASLSVTFYEDGGAAAPGAVTVTIARLDGMTINENPVAATPGDDPGVFTYDLSAAHTADLDMLTVTWASENFGTVTTYAEIVGAHLFTIAEARSHDGADMSSTTAYPNHVIEEARSRIEDAFEEICGVSFIPRIGQKTLNGNGTVLLMLPLDATAIRSVETRTGTTWTAYETVDLDDVILESWGGIVRESRGVWPRGTRNVRVTYEHGYEQPPLEIKRAGLMLLRDSVVSSNIDQRAMSYSDGSGAVYRFITPGLSRGAWFGIPDVNAILQRYERRTPVVG